MAQVTFTLSELEVLTKNRDSGVTLIPNCVRPLLLSPFQLQDLKNCIKTYLYSSVAKYDALLDGIILSYKRIKIEDFFSIQPDGKSKFHYTADIYIFKPKTGSVLSGIINKKGPDHLGCLVHRVFNIAIPRPDNLSNDESWIGSRLTIGQEVQFRVVDVDLNEDMPYIKGELIDQPGLICEDDSSDNSENDSNPQHVNFEAEKCEDDEHISNILTEKSSDKSKQKSSYGHLDDKILKKRDKFNEYEKSKENIEDKINSSKTSQKEVYSNENVTPTKKFQLQNKLIPNRLNDMYIAMSSNTEKNKEIDNVNQIIDKKHKHVKKDLYEIKTGYRENKHNLCINEDNFSKSLEAKNKKDKKNKISAEKLVSNNINISKSNDENNFDISFENDLSIFYNSSSKQKKRKHKRQNSVNVNELHVDYEDNSKSIKENNPNSELRLISNNDDEVVEKSANYVNEKISKKKSSISLNDNSNPLIDEQYCDDYDKNSIARKDRKRRSSLTNDLNEQLNGFQQLKQTMSDIFTNSETNFKSLDRYSGGNSSEKSKTNLNVFKSHKKPADSGFENSNNDNSDLKYNSSCDTERYETDGELEVKRKKKSKKKRKNKNFPNENSLLGNNIDGNLSVENNANITSIKSKHKNKEKITESKDFHDYEIRNDCFLTRVDNLTPGFVTDSELVLKDSRRRKKYKNKDSYHNEKNDINSGFTTDIEITFKDSKRKNKNKDKAACLEEKDDMSVNFITDNELNFKDSRRKNKKYKNDDSYRTVGNDVIEGFVTDSDLILKNSRRKKNRKNEDNSYKEEDDDKITLKDYRKKNKTNKNEDSYQTDVNDDMLGFITDSELIFKDFKRKHKKKRRNKDISNTEETEAKSGFLTDSELTLKDSRRKDKKKSKDTNHIDDYSMNPITDGEFSTKKHKKHKSKQHSNYDFDKITQNLLKAAFQSHENNDMCFNGKKNDIKNFPNEPESDKKNKRDSKDKNSEIPTKIVNEQEVFHENQFLDPNLRSGKGRKRMYSEMSYNDYGDSPITKKKKKKHRHSDLDSIDLQTQLLNKQIKYLNEDKSLEDQGNEEAEKGSMKSQKKKKSKKKKFEALELDLKPCSQEILNFNSNSSDYITKKEKNFSTPKKRKSKDR